VERAGPGPVLAVALAAVDLPQPGARSVGEPDRGQHAAVVPAARRPGDLPVAGELPGAVPQRGRALRLVDLDHVAVVVERHRRGHTRVVAAVTQPGHRAVRLVPAAPVPEVARARAVHLDDLAPAVHRDGGAAAGVALVERTGPGVAGQHREDAAAQLAHG